MGKALVVLGMLLATSAFGQGTILFNNRVAGQVDAPVCRPGGTGMGAGAVAQLFLVTGSGGAATYTALSPATTFRTTSPAAAYYVVQPTEPVTVPGMAAGQQATVVMRAWDGAIGSSYDAAILKTQSNPITITLGGIPAVGAPIPDPPLVGLQFFSFFCVPEPTTIGLTLLGAAVLFYRRPFRS